MRRRSRGCLGCSERYSAGVTACPTLCHSERSEESIIGGRFFVSLRMTQTVRIGADECTALFPIFPENT